MPVDGDIILKAGLDTTGVSKQLDSLQKTVSRGLKNIIRIGFGVRSVFALIRRLRSALLEGFGNLAQVHQPFNQAVSEILTSLNLLKNSFAAAFAPIIETVAPILAKFITMIAEAVSWIGQLIAALTGKEFVRAAAVQVDYASSVDKSAASADKATSATKKQTKAQKELNREITRFDDLVILHDNSKDDADTSAPVGGGGGVAPSYSFSNVPIGDAVSQFAKDFLDAWDKADFTDIGRKLGEKLKSALENIPWPKIKLTLSKIATSIATFLNGFLETPGLFTTIGKTIAEAINSAVLFANRFIATFHWGSLGIAVRERLIAVLSNIDWDLVYDTVNAFAIGLASYLNSLFKPETFEAIGDTVGDLLNGALDFLNYFGENFNASQFGSSLAAGVNAAMKKITPLKLIGGALTIIKALRDALISFMTGVDWYSFGTKLRDTIKNIPWRLILLSVGQVIWQAINTAVELFKGLFDSDNIAGPIQSAIGELSTVIQDAADKIDFKAIGEGLDRIVQALKPAVEGFAVGFINVFTQLAQLGIEFFKDLGPALDAIGGAIESIPAPIVEAVGTALGTFVGALVTMNGLTALSEIAAGAATHIGDLLGVLAEHPLVTMAIGLASIVAGLKSLSDSGFFADADSKKAIENCRSVLEETEQTRRGVQRFLDTAEGKDRDINATYATIRNLADEYFDLKGKVNLTATEQSRLNQLESELGDQLPGFTEIVGSTTQSYSEQKDAVFDLITQTEEYYKVLAAQEYLKEYYNQMFEIEVAIQKNRTAHTELMDSWDGSVTTGNLLTDTVQNIADVFDGTKTAIQDNDIEYANLLQQQKELEKQYGAVTAVLDTYNTSVDESSSSAADAETNTSAFAGVFDLFNGLSLTTPLKMALLSGAIKALGDKGKLSDEDITTLYTTLDEYNANPTEANMAKVAKAFEDTGITADDFTQSLVDSMMTMDTTTQAEIASVLKTITNAGPDLKKKSKSSFENVGKGAKQGVKDTTKDVAEAGEGMVNETLDAMDDAADSHSPSKEAIKRGKYIGQGLGLGLKDQQSSLVQIAGELITAIKNKLDAYTVQFNAVGNKLMKSLGEGLAEGGSQLSSYMLDIMNGIYDSANSLSFWDVGQNIATGIYNGLFAHRQWLNVLAWNTAVSMYNNACRALQISSPSKKFAWIGEMVAVGLGNGVKDNQDEAINAVADMTKSMTSEAEEVSPSVAITSSVDDWISELDAVLTTFSDIVLDKFDNLITTFAQLGNIQANVPAIAQGKVIPSSLQASNSTNDSMANMLDMMQNLQSLASDRMDVSDLRTLLVEMFTRYMNWSIGDEQLARHVNNGNLLLSRRYSIIKE